MSSLAGRRVLLTGGSMGIGLATAYALAERCARLVLRPLAKDGWLSRLPGPGAGWTSVRDFPAPAGFPPNLLGACFQDRFSPDEG